MSNPLKTVAVACDHAGLDLKPVVVAALEARGLGVLDLGTHSNESVDYPVYGEKAAQAIETGTVSRAIVICGSGIGISIAANRSSAVRAALCQSGLMARLARQHNDANVLALGARLVGPEVAADCINAFFDTDFEGGRHQRRVDLLSKTD